MLHPLHGKENQQVSKGMWMLQGHVLASRVGPWAIEGVREAVIHLGGSQSKHGVWGMFLHGTLSPDGKGGILFLLFPTFPSQEKRLKFIYAFAP